MAAVNNMFARPNLTFELTAGCLVLATGIALSYLQRRDPVTASLKLDGMCCQVVSQPIVERIMAVHGVKSADARHADAEIRVGWSARSPASYEEIWNAARRGSLEPTSLTINGRVVKTRLSR